MTKLAFASESLGITKVAGIIVLTEELVRLSNPTAEALVRADMVAGIAQFLDAQFIDPAVAAVAGVNPGVDHERRADRRGDDESARRHHGADQSLRDEQHPGRRRDVHHVGGERAVAVVPQRTSTARRNSPASTINGGSYKGLTFITSNAAGTNVIALQPSLILYADDGGVTIDASPEASLQMDSAPASPADATTVYVSLWQTNTVGLRAERFVNWKRRRTRTR